MNFKALFLCFFLALFSATIHGQPPIQLNQFYFSNSVIDPTDGTIIVKRNSESRYSVNVQIIRPNLPVWTAPSVKYNVEVSAYVKNANGDIRYEINPERVRFTGSDFPGESSTSVLKIGQQLYVPQGFIDENGGEIVARWRYYRENYVYPYDLDGWSDWFVFDVKFPLKLEAISSTIAGPNQICDQGIYTITNPGTVSLVNADGIATLESLNDGTYKVNRIGQATGIVTLRGHQVDGTFIDKTIRIGSFNSADLVFPVAQGQMLEAPFPYGILLPNNVEYASIEWSVSGGDITSVNGSPFIEFITVPGNQRVVVTATITDKCGKTYSISGSRGIRQNPPPGGGGGNPPPTPIEW